MVKNIFQQVTGDLYSYMYLAVVTHYKHSDFLQVCSMWKEIAEIIRDREFSEEEEQLIDIFDIQVHPF